tara:strand:+ start:60 stop:1415 length:1356 start_codon:yes stop_codon:yes gene_type:complete
MRFTDFGSRTVFAAFDGGEITSDAGILLLRDRAKQIGLFNRMAACFADHRDQKRVRHQLPTLLAQRVCGIAMGYEDINDHDSLRNDPAIKLLASPAKVSPVIPVPLAGKSTLNRLEQSREAGNPRYHQMVPNLKKLSNLFTDIFLDSHDAPPKEITLDIDATDIKAHGHQENSFFHGYYEERCFLPLYIFCGHHLLLAQLRPSNIDGARGSRNVIRRIIRIIRNRWPRVKILVRGDSGFARENLMRWCENNTVDYVFGLPRNDYLLKKAQKVRGKAAMTMIKTNEPVRAFGDFYHMTKSKSWTWPRRVIAKVEHKPGRSQQCRFLVTSLGRQAVSPKGLYEDIYCPRGDMENRIKDCQLDLFGDRMSAHDYRANQLRLILAGFAYVLIDSIRRETLQNTPLAKAVPNTIRLKLLKVAARVINSVRRIKISMPNAYPYKDLFFKAHAALAPP